MKKFRFLNVILLVAAICFSVAGIFVVNGNAAKVNADETQTTQTSVFEMEEKASVRLAVPYGIRFRVKMSEDVKARIDSEGATFGFLIFPHAYLGNITADYKTALKASVDISGDKEKIYEEGGYYWANGVLADIKEENLSLDFTSVCYIKEGETYTYAALSQTFKRNVTSVASTAFIKEKEQRSALTSAYIKLGTSAMPVRITSVEDLSVISDEVSNETAPETFSGVNFKLTCNVTIPENFTAIGENFAGVIDADNHTITRDLTTSLIADATKIINADEQVTVDNSKIKLTSIKLTNLDNGGAADYNYGEYSVADIPNSDGVKNAVAYGVSDKGGSAARGNYFLNFNFTKSDVQALINNGYTSFSFKYGIYQDVTKATQITSKNNQLFPSALLWYKNSGSEKQNDFNINAFNTVEVSIVKLLNSFDDNGAAIFAIGGNLDATRVVYFTDFVIAKAESVSILELKKANFINGANGTAIEQGKILDNATLKTNTPLATPCYSDTAGAWEYGTSSGAFVKLNIQLAYTKSELVQLAEIYKTVKINVLAYHASADVSQTGYLKLNKGETGILSENIEFTGVKYEYRKWYELEISIEALINGVSDSGVITLFESIDKAGASPMLYIGDIRLSV